MKLYEVPRNSWVVFKYDPAPMFFDHIDGMYSCCYDTEGNLYHMSAMEEVALSDSSREPPGYHVTRF